MFSSSVRSINILSTPGAIPACGGAPYSKALYNAENLFFISSSVYPAISKAFTIISGEWFLTAPEESSIPLHTISYWYAKISKGDFVFKLSNPPCGIEKGLWQKSNFPLSLISYIGKSTIQQNLYTSLSIKSSLIPISFLISPASFSTMFLCSAIKNTLSPGLVSVCIINCFLDSSSINFAIGPWNSPSSKILIHANPFALHSFIAKSVIPS